MKRLTITIEGEETDDLDLALNRILQEVREEYSRGFARTASAYYEYAITEEESPKCCVCGTTENLHKDGWYGYRCDKPECMVL